MTATVTVTLPKSWVLVRPCGCIVGVALSVGRDETIYTATVEQAWKDFKPGKRERDKAIRDGYVCRGITDDEQARFLEIFAPTCPHEVQS
jgi:hypothetical protein